MKSLVKKAGKPYIVPFGMMQGKNQYLIVNAKGQATGFWEVVNGGKNATMR